MSTLRVGDLVVLAAEDGSLLSAEPLRRRAAVRPPSSSWPHVGGACVFELCLAHATPESAEVWSRELVRELLGGPGIEQALQLGTHTPGVII